MKGFILGLLVATLGFAGYLFWQRQRAGLSAQARATADAGAHAANKKPRRRHHGELRVARGSRTGEGETVHLSAADLRPVAQGDDLSTPDVLHLDMSNGKELPELTQDQIDERFRSQESKILGCISRARPDPETYVPGRVNIKFRIQRSGTVRGVRVEAPAVMQRNGLFGCIKGALMHLRFPAAGTSQIVTYPFTLS